MGEDVRGVRLEIEDLVEVSDDETLAIFQIRGRGRGNGLPVEMPLAWIITIRAGKTVRIQSFLDPVKAFEAAGLRESGG